MRVREPLPGLLPFELALRGGMVRMMKTESCLEIQARGGSAPVSSEEYST